MRSVMTTCVLVLMVFLFNHTAKAAVVEVDVTVKSVDSRARGITVMYKTDLGEKTIDLDVSRKAEITVNGKPGTLDAVKPGQKAKVVFEKELQVVTKIVATGKGTESGREVYRLTLQLSAFGDGKIRIEKTSEAPKDDFKGTPFKLSRWPKTKATKGEGGVFRLVHDFSDPDDINVLATQKHNVAIDKDSGWAVFTPGPIPEANRRGAYLNYAKKFLSPMTVTCDIAKYGGGRFGFHIIRNSLGMLNCIIMSGEHGLDRPFDLHVAWIEAGEGGKQTATTLCHANGITLKDPIEKKFRLPVPNVKATDSAMLELIQGDGDEPTTLSRLEVRGRLAPMFGLEMAEKQGMVFVKNVVPNGLAEKAGFQVGDVLSAINGKKPQTMQEAMGMLSGLPIGDKVVFTVQRGEKTEELRVVAE